MATVSPGLASKPLARVSRFGPQNWQLWFGDLGLKITVIVSWFGSQNQTDFGLSVAPQNQRWEDGAGHASRSGSLLRLEASHTRLFQSGLKTSGGTMVGGARGTITEVVSGSSRRRTGRCDMLHWTLLPLLYRFLCIRSFRHSSLLVFYLGLEIGSWRDGAPCHFSEFHMHFYSVGLVSQKYYIFILIIK
jgi:hypothetical protein